MALTALSNTDPSPSSGDKDLETSGLEDQNLPALPVQRPRGQSLYQGHAPPTAPAEENAQGLLQEYEIGYSQLLPAEVYDWSSAFPFAFDYEELFENTLTSQDSLANDGTGALAPNAEDSVTEDVDDKVVLNPVADIENNTHVQDDVAEALAQAFRLFDDNPSVERVPSPEDLSTPEPASNSVLSTEVSSHYTPEAVTHEPHSLTIPDASPQDATQMASSLVVPEALATTEQPSNRRKRGREDDEDDNDGVAVDAKRNRTTRVSQTTSAPVPSVAHSPAATAVSTPPAQITFLVNTAQPRQIVRCYLLSFSGFVSLMVVSEQQGTCQSCPAGNSCPDTAVYDNKELCPEHYQFWEGLAKLPRWTQAKEDKLKAHFRKLLDAALVKRAEGQKLRAVPPSSVIAMENYDPEYLKSAIPEDGFKKILIWAEDVMIQGLRRRPHIGFTFPGHEDYLDTHPGVEIINTQGRTDLAPGTPRFWVKAQERFPYWSGDDLAVPV